MDPGLVALILGTAGLLLFGVGAIVAVRWARRRSKQFSAAGEGDQRSAVRAALQRGEAKAVVTAWLAAEMSGLERVIGYFFVLVGLLLSIAFLAVLMFTLITELW
jgi:hypothetical protein